MKIKIHRYESTSGAGGFEGYVEPESLAWILYFSDDGTTLFWPRRDADGGVIGDPVVTRPK